MVLDFPSLVSATQCFGNVGENGNKTSMLGKWGKSGDDFFRNIFDMQSELLEKCHYGSPALLHHTPVIQTHSTGD